MQRVSSFDREARDYGEVRWWRRLIQALPDCILGMLGVPVAFSFQKIAEQPQMVGWRLLVHLSFLIGLYLFLVLNFIDIVHEYVQKEHFHGIPHRIAWVVRIGGAVGTAYSIILLAINGSQPACVALAVHSSFTSVSLAALPTVLLGNWVIRKKEFVLWSALVVLVLLATSPLPPIGR